MELRTTREMRRNAQIDKIMGKKAETADTSAGTKAKPAQTGVLADKLTLTQQAIEYIDQQREQFLRQLAERRAQQQSRLAEAQNQSSELDLLSKQMKVMELCEKIAASIMKGDKVPPQDLKYLMVNDPDGYRLAMALRRPKKDPEEVDSVLEDEENQDGAIEETGDSGEASSVEAAAPSATAE